MRRVQHPEASGLPRPPVRRHCAGGGSSLGFLVRLLVPVLILVGSVPAIGQGQGRELVIERFDADIEVLSDGSFHVTETIQARFTGSWNGLEREIFFDHETAEGRRTRFQLEPGEITDAEGNPLRVERSRTRRGIDLRIWVPGAVDAVRTVVIRYRVLGGLRFFDAHGDREPWDELYYDVTGHGWRIPIREASARVRLPEGLEVSGAWGYTGPAGSTEQAVRVETSGGDAEIRTTRPFRPREGLTISVTWPAGGIDRTAVAARPSVATQPRRSALAFWPLALPLIVLAGMLRLWHRKGRDPRQGALMVEYEPPPGLTPPEVGTLVDHKAQMHDITSTLVDLAVRGYVRIEEVEPKRRIPLLGRKEEDWIFHQIRPASAWKELAPHERAYLEGLFEPAMKQAAGPQSLGEFLDYLGDSFGAWRAARREGRTFDAQGFMSDWYRERREAEASATDDPGAEGPGMEEELVQVKLSDLENKFYKHISGIRTKIYRELKNKELYRRRPDHLVARWTLLGVGILFFAFFVAFGAAMLAEFPLFHSLFPEPVSLGLGVGLSGVVVLVVGQGMGVRTEEGSRALARILGFRDFLSRVESDYYDRVVTSPDLFERYLPYAIALQVESRWAKAFDGIYREPPDWYQGPSTAGTFRPTAFAASMSALSTRAGQTMSSSPGSSGSGGGGSSGGGSGGGGGGGF